MYNGHYFQIDDFKGGYAGNLPSTQLELNQAQDLDNIVIRPHGKGFRTIAGNKKFNSTAMNSGANVQGVGYLRQADQDEWLVAIAGAKIYKSDSLDGSMDDITGAYGGITAGAANRWTFMTFNDAVIGFGGPANDPDAAITWPGTGDVSALANAPAAYGGFAANNRVFAFRTKANPSTMYWTIIGDATDWSGSGSGSATIGSLSDNQTITAAVVISTNYVLVFKENSVHQMVISSAPFPVYSLFDNVGTPGKDSVVNVDGTVYFITSLGEMRSTNGETIKEYPKVADDLWNNVQTSQYKNIIGWRERKVDKDWLVWSVSTTGSTNNKAIIWDLINQCWLQCTTGYKMNVVGINDNSDPYLGGYDGIIYKPDQSGTYANASESSPGTITGYWKSGWIVADNIDKITSVRKFAVVFKPKSKGDLTLTYGFDGIADNTSVTLAQTVSNSEVYGEKSSILSGRGNAFEFKVKASSAVIDSEVYSFVLSGKSYGQKDQAED